MHTRSYFSVVLGLAICTHLSHPLPSDTWLHKANVSNAAGAGRSQRRPLEWTNVGKTMPFLPAITGNGKHTTYKNGDDSGMVYYWFTHIMFSGILNGIYNACFLEYLRVCHVHWPRDACLQRIRVRATHNGIFNGISQDVFWITIGILIGYDSELHMIYHLVI